MPNEERGGREGRREEGQPPGRTWQKCAVVHHELDVVEGQRDDLGAEGCHAESQEGVKLEEGDAEEVVLTKGRAGGPHEPFLHL